MMRGKVLCIKSVFLSENPVEIKEQLELHKSPRFLVH